jgi:hypothetical protein
MTKQLHPWKRFWCPREGRYSLADDGFLVDPESEIGRYYAEDVRSFEDIQQYPCLVLLGEPGAGKSTALKQNWARLQETASANRDAELRFDLREFSTDQRLASKILGSPGLEAWKKGQHRLHLGLDSLDESLLRIPTISEVLKTELQDLDISRLRPCRRLKATILRRIRPVLPRLRPSSPGCPFVAGPTSDSQSIAGAVPFGSRRNPR